MESRTMTNFGHAATNELFDTRYTRYLSSGALGQSDSQSRIGGGVIEELFTVRVIS